MNLDELITALENFPQKVATNCESIMKEEVPVHTGNLRDSIKTVWHGKDSFFVGTDDVEYATYVFHGRRGFGVDPETGRTSHGKRALHWVLGTDVFVHHVGPAKANNYLSRTLSRLRLYLTLH